MDEGEMWDVDAATGERMSAPVYSPDFAEAPRRRGSVWDAVIVAARFGQVGDDAEHGRLKTATMRQEENETE
jgi:hypothetical protein